MIVIVNIDLIIKIDINMMKIIDIDINMNNIWTNENANSGAAASLLLSSAPTSLVSRFETDF